MVPSLAGMMLQTMPDAGSSNGYRRDIVAPMAVARRAAEAFAVAAAAALLTVAIALPVLRDPQTRVFGAEIAGRHHDPFTVMRQLEQPLRLDVYTQPVTDFAGAALARLAGGVAGYNWLVLLSFPFAAATAFLLARHLDLSRGAAVFAALLFAFSPFHVAQAAYHPHVAQVQWIPLYLLALFRALDRASVPSLLVLAVATIGVTLSNFYGGLIAAVITPVAAAAYWAVRVRGRPGAVRHLAVTGAALAVIAATGLAYVWRVAPGALLQPAALGFARAELFRYSAKWWGYFVPPVINPWLGRSALAVWTAANVGEGLLEQQVTIGAGVAILAAVAIAGWIAGRRGTAVSWPVPVLVVTGLTAMLVSLSPERTIHGIHTVRPSALLYAIVPMFRSYARFGVVVQLAAALLAGLGLDRLRRNATSAARGAAAGLVALAVFEYAVVPSALWRDVLPTPAHRWVMQQDARTRALDCVPLTPESASVEWLSQGRIHVLGGAVADCYEPNVAQKLAALGYTHVIVRLSSAMWPRIEADSGPANLHLAAVRRGARVYAITAPVPPIYTGATAGFAAREFEGPRTWCWMGGEGTWQVVNTTGKAVAAVLGLELQSFGGARRLEILLDGRAVRVVRVEPARQLHEIAFTLPAGQHLLTFRPREGATIADAAAHNADPRALSVAFGEWTWRINDDISGP